jgi:hypothetical protein
VFWDDIPYSIGLVVSRTRVFVYALCACARSEQRIRVPFQRMSGHTPKKSFVHTLKDPTVRKIHYMSTINANNTFIACQQYSTEDSLHVNNTCQGEPEEKSTERSFSTMMTGVYKGTMQGLAHGFS